MQHCHCRRKRSRRLQNLTFGTVALLTYLYVSMSPGNGPLRIRRTPSVLREGRDGVNCWTHELSLASKLDAPLDGITRAIIVPSPYDFTEFTAALWGSSDADHTLVLLIDAPRNSLSSAAGSRPSITRPQWPLDVSVWRSPAPGALSDYCAQGVSAACFPGVAAAIPGISAALATGAATIIFVSDADPSEMIAAGVVFPTSNVSRLPLVPLDQVPDAASTGRTLLPDFPCEETLSQPAPSAASSSHGDTPMCQSPPRDAKLSGSYSHGQAGMAADLADVAGRHFITTRRVSQDGLTLCSVPVVAAVQYGLCQPQTQPQGPQTQPQGPQTQPQGPQTQPQGPPLSDEWAAFLSAPLDDQATPLVLPLGAVPPTAFGLGAGSGDVLQVSYGGMAVHATLVWAFLPVIEPGLGPGIMGLFQAVLALFGHAAVILPPGRLCGRSPSHPGSSAASSPQSVTESALDVAALQGIVARLLRSLRTGATVSELLNAALLSTDVRDAAQLSDTDGDALAVWLDALTGIGFTFPVVRSAHQAALELDGPLRSWMVSGTPAAAAANATVTAMDATLPDPASPLTSAALVYLFSLADELARTSRRLSLSCLQHLQSKPQPDAAVALLPEPLGVPLPVALESFRHLRHCFADGAHVRDIALVIVHTRLVFPDANAVLLKSYAPYFPVIRLAGQYVFTPENQGKNPPAQTNEPLWGMIPCGGWLPASINPNGVSEGGGNAAHHCWLVGMAADPGHLGYLVTNDDSVVQPWNLRALRADRPWSFGAILGQQMNKVYPEHYPAFKSALPHFRARDLSKARLNFGAYMDPPEQLGYVPHLADTAFFPGRLAADAVRLLDVFLQNGVYMEIAITTTLCFLAPLDEIEEMQAVFVWHDSREHTKFFWAFHWDVYHPLKLSTRNAQHFVLRQFQRAAELRLHVSPPLLQGVRVGPNGRLPLQPVEEWRPQGWPDGAPGKVKLVETGIWNLDGTGLFYDPVRDPVVGYEWESDVATMKALRQRNASFMLGTALRRV